MGSRQSIRTCSTIEHDMLGCRIPTALVAMCHRTQDAREARLKQSRMSHTIQQTRHLHVANMYCVLNQVGQKQHIKWSQVDEAVQSNWFARLLCTACSNHCQHFYYEFKVPWRKYRALYNDYIPFKTTEEASKISPRETVLTSIGCHMILPMRVPHSD